jgi:hypothetical protein
MFVNKNGRFRPAGGDIHFQASNRVTPVFPVTGFPNYPGSWPLV